MATLVLSAAGSSLGGAFGGAAGGLGLGVLGRAAGAVAGGLLDQQVFGRGAKAVETGRVESFRLQHAQEGVAIPRIQGRMRVGGQLIWSSDFLEHVDETREGGKGGQKVRQYRYSVSFAVALCEGRITRIGRVWADGNELRLEDVTYRVYRGGQNQAPDPLIDTIEDGAPGFRGISYIVFENLPLGPFGNRIPQINVEVYRAPRALDGEEALSEQVKAVALSPGSGEFSLDTEPVERAIGKGYTTFENVNTLSERPDILSSLDQLEAEAPNCKAISLIVSWFGDDLRCDRCDIRPGVEIDEKETRPYSWRAGGVGRGGAHLVSQDAEGRPIYGGTPSDASVIRSIQEMNARGQDVMFYPFILMDVPEGNTKVDPYTGSAPQPVFPWRGRITTSRAPGVAGSTDKTAAAAAEVTAFFGGAEPGDFSPDGDHVDYGGPSDWGFRRFILHNAHLCALAGGVDSFCIGSEMRGLTWIRDGAASYPAVEEMRRLAADVRQILGPNAKIGYAADWSEYFGHQPQDGSGDVFFHLDPLWSDPAIDFVGIDNYLPLSDWRYEPGHADESAGSIYARGYLEGNVEGGEGFDWYYASQADRDAQLRTPITDGAHGEDWIFRPKDLVNWWSQPHHDRPGGVRAAQPTGWIPESKPIWFTELGCPAVDLGANQPNVFVDPKSSESALPYYSRGVRDDFMQRRYIEAVLNHWTGPTNPSSSVYGDKMLDKGRIFLWTWDARPYPDFPARLSVWSDGGAHRLGHWLTGRLGAAPLADVVADICRAAGFRDFDVSGLRGVVEGMKQEGDQTARQALQGLMLAHGFDAVESEGVLRFAHRDGPVCASLSGDGALLSQEGAKGYELIREPEGETPRAVRLSFIDSDGEYEAGATEASAPATSSRVETANAPLAMDRAQAQDVADRWLAEARVARDGATYLAPRSTLALEPGDIVELAAERPGALYRIDRVEDLGRRELTLTRVEPATHAAAPLLAPAASPQPVTPAAPVEARLLDLPLTSDDEAVAPRFAAFAEPWTSPAALSLSLGAEDYREVARLGAPSVMGETATEMGPAQPDRWTRGAGVDLLLYGGGLQARSDAAVLNGDNALAIRHGGGWEVVQFQAAELVAENFWRLSRLLRGQRGTDDLAELTIPAGVDVLLLDASLADVALSSDLVSVPLDYRAGPARKPHTHASWRDLTFTFEGRAWRPYRPAHLKARADGADLRLSWIRRTRVGGDGWTAPEVPLAEQAEQYRLRILVGGLEVRSEDLSSPTFLYDAASRAADGASSAFEARVSQFSDRFGFGPEAKVTVNG